MHFCIVKFLRLKREISELEGVEITRPGQGVVKIKYPDNGEITIGLARRLTGEVLRRFGRGQIALVHVAGEHTTIAAGVREYLAAKPAYSNKIAEAFVVKNLNQRILGNAYLRMAQPVCPSEVFTLEDEAVKWVKMYCPAPPEENNSPPPAQNFSAN